MVDFISRLHMATNHFPSSLQSKKAEIKTRLRKETTVRQVIFEGKEHQYTSLRNFGFKELIKIHEDYLLIGSKKETYDYLRQASHFRNRVHISNYFGNFERDESRVFSETRTQRTIDYMVALIKHFESKYPRP